MIRNAETPVLPPVPPARLADSRLGGVPEVPHALEGGVVMRTKNSLLSDAELCRRNGWRRGTRLIGDEGNGPQVITITAVGRDQILAIGESDHYEMDWTLKHRNWRKMK